MTQETEQELSEEAKAALGEDSPKWKSFFRVDFKDKWNWLLGILAIILLWWGIKTILHAFKGG